MLDNKFPVILYKKYSGNEKIHKPKYANDLYNFSKALKPKNNTYSLRMYIYRRMDKQTTDLINRQCLQKIKK